LREANLLLIAVGMLLGPFVTNWRLAIATLRRVEVRRHVRSRIHAGGSLAVDIEMQNTRRWLGAWIVVVKDLVAREAIEPDGKPVTAEVMFPYVRAGESRGRTYRVNLPHRGEYRLGPLCITTRFPFGLFRRTIEFGGQESVLVLPRLGRLTPAWRQGYQAALQGQRGINRPTRAVGDFFAVREWQSGDSVRLVHWRGTARHGQLMVRQFEQPGERNTAILVDLWQPENPSREDLENVELAVSFAATVVADLCRVQRSRLLLGIAGPTPVCLSGIACATLMEDALEKLAVASASAENRLEELFEAVAGQIGAGEEIVLVSTRHGAIEDGIPHALSDSLPQRPAGHERIRTLGPTDREFGEFFLIQ
jgi:uncharacterized protein (DUF58 family)